MSASKREHYAEVRATKHDNNDRRYVTYRRSNFFMGSNGVAGVFGILPGYNMQNRELQAVRFDSAAYTIETAIEWLRMHEIPALKIEAATESGETSVLSPCGYIASTPTDPWVAQQLGALK